MGSKSLNEGVCQRYLSVQHGGMQRNFIVHAPQQYCRSAAASRKQLEPIPIIVAIHGFGAPPGMFTSIFGELIVPMSFILVQPLGTGSPSSFNGLHCCGSAVENKVDDVGFLKEIIRNLQQWLPVDLDGIVGTGFSNGAFLLELAVSSGASIFSSVVPVGGHLFVAGQNLSHAGPIPVFLQVCCSHSFRLRCAATQSICGFLFLNTLPTNLNNCPLSPSTQRTTGR